MQYNIGFGRSIRVGFLDGCLPGPREARSNGDINWSLELRWTGSLEYMVMSCPGYRTPPGWASEFSGDFRVFHVGDLIRLPGLDIVLLNDGFVDLLPALAPIDREPKDSWPRSSRPPGNSQFLSLPAGKLLRIGGYERSHRRGGRLEPSDEALEVRRMGSSLMVRTASGQHNPFSVNGVPTYYGDFTAPVSLAVGGLNFSWDGGEGLLVTEGDWQGQARVGTPFTRERGLSLGKSQGLYISDLTSISHDGAPTLSDLSMVAPPGLTVLCGPSGLGKTTLLRVLCGERDIHKGSKISLQGAPFNPKDAFISGQAVMVPQDTSLIGNLNAYETIDYAYKLRIGGTDEQRSARVRELMRLLELDQAEKTLMRDLSGGQKKHLSLAVELVIDPSLLLLDEPNSGLDALADKELLELLRTIRTIINRENPVVIAVTHVLSHCTVSDWSIAMGVSSTAANSSSAPHTGAAIPCIAYCGPYGGMAEGVTGVEDADEAEIMEGLRSGVQQVTIEPDQASDEEAGAHAKHKPRRKSAVSHLRQFVLLSQREIRRRANDWPGGNAWRQICARIGLSEVPTDKWNPTVRAFGAETLIPVILGITVGLLGYTVCKEPMGAHNRLHTLAAILSIVVLTCFIPIAFTAPTIMDDWTTLRRENRWGVPIWSQLMARLTSNVVRVLLFTTAAAVTFVYISPTPEYELINRYAAMCLILGVLGLVSSAFGLFLGAMAQSLKQVMVIMFIVMALLVILSGAAFPLDDLGSVVRDWASLALPSRLAVAASANEVGIIWLQSDKYWQYSLSRFYTNIGILAGFGVFYQLLAIIRVTTVIKSKS